jgi:RNA recognition motif-containing protein
MPPQGVTDKVTTFKIHVKNLPIDTTDEELKAIFEEFGRVVECKVALKKSFGFVVS